MFLSMLAVGLAGYGYVTGDTWVIVASVIVSVIGLRKAVFSFDRIGALANFVILIAGVVLGALNFTNVKLPSFPDVGTNKQEVAKQVTPPPNISNNKPTVSATAVKPPSAPIATPTLDSLSDARTLAKGTSSLPCAEQSHLNNVVVGEKRIPDEYYIKICRNTKEVRIPYMTNLRWQINLWQDEKLLPNIQMLVKVNSSENGVLKLSPKLDGMKKAGAESVIVKMHISNY